MSFRKSTSFNDGSLARATSMKNAFLQNIRSVDLNSPKSKTMVGSRNFNILFQDYKTDSIQEALVRAMIIVLGLNYQGMNQLQELIKFCSTVESSFAANACQDAQLLHHIQSTTRIGSYRQDGDDNRTHEMVKALGDFALKDREYRQITEVILKLLCPFLKDTERIIMARQNSSLDEIFDSDHNEEFWDGYRIWMFEYGDPVAESIPIVYYLLWILQYMQEVKVTIRAQLQERSDVIRETRRLRKKTRGPPLHMSFENAFDQDDDTIAAEYGIKPDQRVGSFRFDGNWQVLADRSNSFRRTLEFDSDDEASLFNQRRGFKHSHDSDSSNENDVTYEIVDGSVHVSDDSRQVDMIGGQLRLGQIVRNPSIDDDFDSGGISREHPAMSFEMDHDVELDESFYD